MKNWNLNTKTEITFDLQVDELKFIHRDELAESRLIDQWLCYVSKKVEDIQ